jgi:predicted RNA-binding Zn ribbon-like protein
LRYGGQVLSDADHHDARLLVDLINTHYLGDESDVLAGAGARRWLREHLGSHRRVPAPTALQPLRDLREGLRQLAIGNNGGRPDRATVARADAVLRQAPLVIHLSGTGGHQVIGAATGAGSTEEIVAALGVAYLTSRLNGAWRRVKACAEPGCRWAFFDLSRNASRRWCEMAECGNRAKNRAFRARHPNQRA